MIDGMQPLTHLPPAEHAAVLDVLQGVKDPEIPVVSLVELGVIDAIGKTAEGTLQVGIIPTFAGCPAIELMRQQVEVELKANGYPGAKAVVQKTTPWSSDRISERGRQLLKEFGLSPPPAVAGDGDPDLEHAECPHCESRNTQLLNPFGPTLCRAMHHCHNCHQTFEQFKPL